ncbi:MAG: transcription antitermination factor NusB [Anderseniella sp.]
MGVKKARRAPKFTPPDIHVDGLPLRLAAVNALSQVLEESRFLEDALAESLNHIEDSRDRTFAHAIAAITLRHKGQIDTILSNYIEQKLRTNTGKASVILLCGVAQLIFMDIEPHAAISTSVAIAAQDEKTHRLKGLINAVLRNIALDRDTILANLPAPDCNLPKWLHTRLKADYGTETVLAIAHAHTEQADLDLTFRSSPIPPALLDIGMLLPTGSLRVSKPHPAIPELPGFAAGDWWVQDAAAALPVLLFGELSGKKALDMCAAPGGKTLQLCAAGADVTALDSSQTRLKRVTENLARTGLSAQCLAIDAIDFATDDLFDCILLDAPCSATGTIRRHPDMPFMRDNDDVKQLLVIQRNLLRKAAGLLKPGGTLIYAVCSLLADEGPKQVAGFLNQHRDFSRVHIDGETDQIPTEFISKNGDLRTLPHMSVGNSAGLDGFFAARLRKSHI